MTIKQKKKKNSNLIIVVISTLIIILGYFVITIIQLFQKPVDTVLIKKGELINYEEVIGYVIRNEEIIDTSAYTGMKKWEAPDATKISKGSPMITYVSSSETEILDKIEKLDEKIEKAMESSQTVFDSDVKTIEAEIENYIYININDNKNLNSIREYKKYLNSRIETKAKIAGELSPVGSELKRLINERAEYEKVLNDSEKALIAPKSGLVSYRIDGKEDVLTYDAISLLTSKSLNELKITQDGSVPISSKEVKLIDNFACYIAVPMKKESTQNIKLNDIINLRFKNTGDTLIPATVDYISNEEDGVLVIFKVKSNVEELTKYRKISLDVVWWNAKGFKVTTKAIIRNENDVPKVTVKKAYYMTDSFVKILKETDDYVIIDNYTDDELRELGVDEAFIKDRYTIKMYDEVLVVT